MNKIIYAPGTKVKLADGTVTTICGVSLSTGAIEYSTLHGAWFNHEAVTWVDDPTPESLAEAIDYESKDEDGADYEEEDDDCRTQAN